VAIFAFIVISLAIATTSVLADSTRITAGGNHLAHQLLFMDDEELLSIISKKAFDYFWHEANPHNGLIPHSDAENSPCSIAAVGLGLSAIPIGIERGWIGREEGYDRIATTLSTLSSDRIQRTNGFFYQLLDMDEGIRFQERQGIFNGHMYSDSRRIVRQGSSSHKPRSKILHMSFTQL